LYDYTRRSSDVASYTCRNIQIHNAGDAEWKIMGYYDVRRR